MRNLLLITVILFYSVNLNAQKLSKLNKDIESIGSGKFSFEQSDFNGKVLVKGYLSSRNPEVKDGEFKFYNSKGKLEAIGYYRNDRMVGIWKYYSAAGELKREINYDKTYEFLDTDTTISEYSRGVYSSIENMPKFEGGNMANFGSYVEKNKVYPIYSKKNNIAGRVYVSFAIDKKGYLRSINIERSSGSEELDLEALRVLSESPKWEPGFKRNKKVFVFYKYVIVF